MQVDRKFKIFTDVTFKDSSAQDLGTIENFKEISNIASYRCIKEFANLPSVRTHITSRMLVLLSTFDCFVFETIIYEKH